jgi:hypothetical protein
MTIVKFPYEVCRRAHARRPRRSKNGTPEERATAQAPGRPDGRFAKPPVPSLPWTRDPEEIRARFAPSVKGLPFVSSEWTNDYWPESMWADIPTNDHWADMDRGRRFAVMTIEAMRADKADALALEAIFKSIVEDAIRRKAKGGKGSRSIPGAVRGYLEGLAELITHAVQS